MFVWKSVGGCLREGLDRRECKRDNNSLRKSKAAGPGPAQAFTFLDCPSTGSMLVVPLRPFISFVSIVDIVQTWML